MALSLIFSVFLYMMSSNKNLDSGIPQHEGEAAARKVVFADLKMDDSNSTQVISSAQKFVIPVGSLGQKGEPLVYPESHEKAGQPILDYKGKPIGKQGIIFFNEKDKAYQAVAGDGKGVIIINEVTQEQAQKLYQKIREFCANPYDLNLGELKQVLAFAQEELGLLDMYNSSRSFIEDNMTPVSANEIPQIDGKKIEAFGFMKRESGDINLAVYIPGKFVFEGPAASPQQFEKGGVIVVHKGHMRGIQPDVFARTYRLSDGRPIASAATDLKTFNP